MELKEGMLAISKAGHDKGCWYVVVKLEDEYAFLADGKNRLMEHPKRKKLKANKLMSHGKSRGC